MKKIYSLSVILLFISLYLLFSCGSDGNTTDTKIIPDVEFPHEGTPKKIELTYDSTVFLKDSVAAWGMLACEVYFSDKAGHPYRFNVYEYLGSLHGYRLYDPKVCNRYVGAKFLVQWNFQGDYDADSTITVNRIEGLQLRSSVDVLKRRVIKLNPSDSVAAIIDTAQAGDSIVFEPGVYYLDSRNITVKSDYTSLVGEPGVFIYANLNVDVLEINAHHVLIHNLYLSHLNAENAYCSGDVISINTYSSLSAEISSCDINGCGVTGISFYAIERNNDASFIVKDNFIHNNSDAPYSHSMCSEGESDAVAYGVKFSGNRLWNNGIDKTSEPNLFKCVFLFGMPDSLVASVDSCESVSCYSFPEVVDSLIPYYSKSDKVLLGYLNPAEFMTDKKSGVVVLERFKPVKVYDTVPELCQPLLEQSDKIVIVYADSVTINSYFEQGGEDWSYFTDEVWQYFDDKQVTVTSNNLLSDQELRKLIGQEPEIGMGYYFVVNGIVLFVEHDLPYNVINAGNAFFKQQAACEVFEK